MKCSPSLVRQICPFLCQVASSYRRAVRDFLNLGRFVADTFAPKVACGPLVRRGLFQIRFGNSRHPHRRRVQVRNPVRYLNIFLDTMVGKLHDFGSDVVYLLACQASLS